MSLFVFPSRLLDFLLKYSSMDSQLQSTTSSVLMLRAVVGLRVGNLQNGYECRHKEIYTSGYFSPRKIQIWAEFNSLFSRESVSPTQNQLTSSLQVIGSTHSGLRETRSHEYLIINTTSNYFDFTFFP